MAKRGRPKKQPDDVQFMEDMKKVMGYPDKEVYVDQMEKLEKEMEGQVVPDPQKYNISRTSRIGERFSHTPASLMLEEEMAKMEGRPRGEILRDALMEYGEKRGMKPGVFITRDGVKEIGGGTQTRRGDNGGDPNDISVKDLTNKHREMQLNKMIDAEVKSMSNTGSGGDFDIMKMIGLQMIQDRQDERRERRNKKQENPELLSKLEALERKLELSEHDKKYQELKQTFETKLKEVGEGSKKNDMLEAMKEITRIKGEYENKALELKNELAHEKDQNLKELLAMRLHDMERKIEDLKDKGKKGTIGDFTNQLLEWKKFDKEFGGGDKKEDFTEKVLTNAMSSFGPAVANFSQAKLEEARAKRMDKERERELDVFLPPPPVQNYPVEPVVMPQPSIEPAPVVEPTEPVEQAPVVEAKTCPHCGATQASSTPFCDKCQLLMDNEGGKK